MAKTPYHFEPTEGATPHRIISSESMTLGKRHIHECVKAHSELADRIEEVNRSWIENLRSEADLSAEFTSRMIAVRSIAGAARVILEWTVARWNWPPQTLSICWLTHSKSWRSEFVCCLAAQRQRAVARVRPPPLVLRLRSRLCHP
jgi:hypothetical protein